MAADSSDCWRKSIAGALSLPHSYLSVYLFERIALIRLFSAGVTELYSP